MKNVPSYAGRSLGQTGGLLRDVTLHSGRSLKTPFEPLRFRPLFDWCIDVTENVFSKWTLRSPDGFLDNNFNATDGGM